MLCNECGFDNPKGINICSMCGSSMGISVNKLHLNKEVKSETEIIPEPSYVVYSENAKAISFPLKTIAVLFFAIVIATGGFYGYQLFRQELLKEENARKDAELKSISAQREAEEAAKQASEIRANAILEKEKFAVELAKQQAVLEAKNSDDSLKNQPASTELSATTPAASAYSPEKKTKTTYAPPINSTMQTSNPSFDCAKASTNSEHLICSNANLAAADVEMAQIYRQVFNNTIDKKALKREQNQWRKTNRDACEDVPCILNSYAVRTKQLNERNQPEE
jgi:hypothetical protein